MNLSPFHHYRKGSISLEDYMSFMISRETENVQSLAEVVNAFRAITADGERPYVLDEEITQVWPYIIILATDTYKMACCGR